MRGLTPTATPPKLGWNRRWGQEHKKPAISPNGAR